MNDQEAEAWREKEIAATNYRSKLRDARERKGLTEHQAAALMKIGSAAYYDLEAFEGDITGCYSLNEILLICKSLDLRPRELFFDVPVLPLSIDEVISQIARHCSEKSISIAEFEDIAGWRIASCLANPRVALDEWCVDCLMDICRESGVEWSRAIAGL